MSSITELKSHFLDNAGTSRPPAVKLRGPSRVHWLQGILLPVLILALGFANTISAAEAVRSFTSGSLEQILASREGRPFMLALWSLDCQYCPTELKMFGELKRIHPELDVVLIATDTITDIPQLVARAEGYGLGKMEQWVFAEDMPERLRLEIDPRWYGEVPRTYFYDEKHQRQVRTGIVSSQFVEEWLARNAAAKSVPLKSQ